MRRRVRALVERLPLTFRVLYRQFLTRVVDLEALSIDADVLQLLGQLTGVLILIGGFETVEVWFAAAKLQGHPASLAGLGMYTEQALLAGTMLMAGLAAVVTWDNIFPDRRDVMVLGALPVKPRMILVAKLAAAGTLLGVGVVALNFGIGVVLPLIAGPGWKFPRVLASYWFTVGCAALFVYGAVLAVQGITAALLPQRWFLRLSALLQLAAFALFLCAWLFQPEFSSVATMRQWQQTGELMRWPMFWFFGLFGKLSGVFPFVPESLADRAWMALLVVLLGAGASLLLCYLRTMKRTVEEPDLVPRRRGRLLLLPLGDSLDTAVVRFSMRSLARSRQHRVVYAFFLAIAFAIAVSTLVAVERAHHAQPMSVDFLMGTLMMMCLAVLGLRSIFSLPVSLRANWVLQITQLRPAEDYLAATRRAVMVMATIPVWLTAAALSLCYRPWTLAAEHLVVLAVAGSIVTDAVLIGAEKIPFACSYLPGKTNVQYLFWAIVVGVTPLALVFSRYELSVLRDPLRFRALLGAMLVVAGALWWWNEARARSTVLHYEDVEAEVVTGLHIGPTAWRMRDET